MAGPRDPVPVVCGIIERSGLILACRRNERQTNAGLWEFPGGKVGAGEAPEAALVREIQEELGIGIVPQTSLTPVTHDYPWIAIRLIPYVCSAAGPGNPHPHEHAEIRWVDRTGAAALEWAPADRPVVEEYFQAVYRPA